MEININELISELKEQDLSKAIVDANTYVLNTFSYLSDMKEHGGNYDDTKKELDNITKNVLSEGSEMSKISSKYGCLVGNTNVLNQAKYDFELGKALTCLQDIVNIQFTIKAVNTVVMSMVWLKNGYSLIKAKTIFDQSGFDKSIMAQYKTDINLVYSLISSHHDDSSTYTRNLASLDLSNKNNLKEYDKARDLDFLNLFNNTMQASSIRYNYSANRFRLDPKAEAAIQALDKLSKTVCELIDVLADLEVTSAACDVFFEGPFSIPSTDGCKLLLENLKNFVLLVRELDARVLEIHDNFKKRGDDEPYCFMQKLEVSVSGYRLGELNKDDPIKTGLHMSYNYRKLFESLNDYRKDYIRGFGLIK